MDVIPIIYTRKNQWRIVSKKIINWHIMYFSIFVLYQNIRKCINCATSRFHFELSSYVMKLIGICSCKYIEIAFEFQKQNSCFVLVNGSIATCAIYWDRHTSTRIYGKIFIDDGNSHSFSICLPAFLMFLLDTSLKNNNAI